MARRICLTIIFSSQVMLACASPRPASVCELSLSDRRWLEKALGAWERAGREFLRLNPVPMPLVMVFNGACVWYLDADDTIAPDRAGAMTSISVGGGRVPVHAVAHQGTIELPNGAAVPVHGLAVTLPYRNNKSAFVAMALLDVWRREARYARTPQPEEFFLGVFIHRMVHTLQLASLHRRVEQLKSRYALPETLDDDLVQKRFGANADFRLAFEAERDLFLQAAADPDLQRSRALAARALAMTHKRQARHFTGADAVFADLEPLLLNTEGIAAWTRFKLSQVDPLNYGASDPHTIISPYWVQAEGLALCLLLEKLMPGWQERALGGQLVSPFELLEQALAAAPRSQ